MMFTARKCFVCLFGCVCFFLLLCGLEAPRAAAQLGQESPEIAGEFFGVPVPASNYYFAKRAVMSFGAAWRGTPQTEEELEDLVWQELMFSYEAFRRGIEALPEEVDAEIEKMLQQEKVDFRWRVDKEKFQEWTTQTLGIPPEVFRNQVEHLVKLEKLRRELLESFDPPVSEEEAYQKFLDEYNSLSVELVQFDELEEAERFYERVNKPAAAADWETLIWEDCVFSREASGRDLFLDEEELERFIGRLMFAYRVSFRWKEDEPEFAQWVRENMGMSAEEFLRRVRQILLTDVLRRQISEEEEKRITEREEFRKVLTRYKTVPRAYRHLSKAVLLKEKDKLLLFSSFDKAGEFYEKIRRKPGLWEDLKRKNPKDFKQPGFVALDFLLHMWGFDREAAYKMLEQAPGTYYPPAPIYKGYGVFKVMEIRIADPERYEGRKEYYEERVKSIKRHEEYRDWVKNLKEQADVKVYK